MAWDTEMVGLLRVYINDMDTPYRFSDVRLKQVLVAAAKIVLFDTASSGFATEYTASLTDLTIIPDPITEVPDENFENLTVLKAGCFIDNGEMRTAVRKSGLAVKEFSSSFDTKNIADARIKVLELGWCKTYDDSLFSYLAGNAAVGQAIIGPFRTYYNYNCSGRR